MPIPTLYIRGKMISAATVWLINVAPTNISREKETRTLYKLMPSTCFVMIVAMLLRRPEEFTALPRDKPPAARMMMVQRKLLKSSLVRMPVPKKRTMGMMATIPISPKSHSS